MRSALGLLALFALVASLGTCAASKGAVHEIAALIWLLIATVAGAAYSILGKLDPPKPPPPKP